MTALYDFHLNFEALHRSTKTFESLLNKYRQEDEDVECVYQTLKDLFHLIKTGQLKRAISGNLEAGYILGERGLKSKYPDLANAYATFSWDVSGLTDDPRNVNLDKMIEEMRAKVLAEKAAQESK